MTSFFLGSLWWIAAATAAAPATANPTPAAESLAAVARDSATAAPDSAALPFRLVPRGVVASAGDGRGQVVEPSGVACDAFGRVWVSDAQLHRIQRFDKDGRWLGEAGLLGSGEGELRRPGSLASLGAADMGVLDQENRRVLDYDLFGRLVGTRIDLADPTLEGTVGRVDPSALAADRGGAVYVADPARERVLVFDGSGQFVRALGEFGARPGQFRGLQGLAAAPKGELIVTERWNARLQRLDAGGRPAGSWAIEVEPRASGAIPVAVDGQGRVAVADEATGKLWVFDPAGRRVGALAGLGHPRALAFAPDGTLLLAETQPARVRRLALVAVER